MRASVAWDNFAEEVLTEATDNELSIETIRALQLVASAARRVATEERRREALEE